MEQQQLREMVQRFPTPRLQTDDGNLETAELHAREDLLLDNYSWVDRQSGKVRIPIARAMELIAQHGLPVAPEEQTETFDGWQTRRLWCPCRSPMVSPELVTSSSTWRPCSRSG